jgi:23S rRNA-/tRNA-specific pseudouridylate synthase
MSVLPFSMGKFASLDVDQQLMRISDFSRVHTFARTRRIMMEHPNIIIVAETDELVVVDKSSTMVVHSTPGSSRYNTLLTTSEMRFERKLYTIHRSLDRVTSGILGLASDVVSSVPILGCK